MRHNQARFWLAGIMAVAVGLRVLVAFYLGSAVEVLPGIQDQVSYDLLAQRVLAGYGFSFEFFWWPATPAGQPTAHWSFLYTLYLAAVYGVAGYQPLLARLLQAVLSGLLMPWLAYRIGRRYFGEPVGLVSAGLTAGYAYFVYYAAALMTETFYIVAILWVLDRVGQLGQTGGSRRWGRLALEGGHLGLALATAVLLRQVFLLMIPVLGGWLLWRSLRRQTHPAGAMVMALTVAGLVLALSILPWTIRNYRAFNTFVLLNTNAGYAFFWGNHPIHGYNFISILGEGQPAYIDLIPGELRHLNEAELDRALLKLGLGFVQADPLRYLILSVSRLKDYFMFWPSADSGWASNLSRVLSFGLLWPFMGAGLVLKFRRAPLILYLFTAAYTGVHLLTWALIRYRLPVDAVLIIFAGVALVDLYSWLAQRRPFTWLGAVSR